MELIEILKQNKIEYKENEEMKPYTTLHIGGNADLVLFPKSIQEIQLILQHVQPIVLGNGSNVLISDSGLRQPVMILRHLNRIEAWDQKIICEAGASLKDVCLQAKEHTLSGLEFAYGIPGSVGGAIYMNAGAYGNEMCDVVKEVVVWHNKEIKTWTKKELAFAYRHSCFMENDAIILSVVFQLNKGNQKQIQMKMDELWQKRLEKQPLDRYSAGSTFKRGSDYYASALISECGLKGHRVNGASVSKKHAGFLINDNQATFQDFYQLMEEVREIVEEKTGKVLEPEVKILK